MMKGIISYCHKNTKVKFFFVICIKIIFPQGTLWNKVPCADRYQCMPSLYSWKMHMSNSLAFPVHQVSKIFYKQINCSNIYSWWKETYGQGRRKISLFFFFSTVFFFWFLKCQQTRTRRSEMKFFLKHDLKRLNENMKIIHLLLTKTMFYST